MSAAADVDLSHIEAPIRGLAEPLDAVDPDSRNARRHDDRNLQAIRASLEGFRQQTPLVVDADGILRKGHGTLEAARILGWTHIAVSRSSLSGYAAQAYAVADNRTSDLSTFDDVVLAELLKEIGASDDLEDAHLLEATGFSDAEIGELIAAAEVAELGEVPGGDEVPPVEEEVHSERGEVYELGPHRIMCGDATSAEDVAALLDGETPRLMVTDPPYGVGYDPTHRDKLGVAPARRRGGFDDSKADWSAAWMLFEGDVGYVWHANLQSDVVIRGLEDSGLVRRSCLIWRKGTFTIGRGHYHWLHEPCWYAVRKGKTSGWIGKRNETTVWDVAQVGGFGSSHDEDDQQGGHGCQKPIECMERPIRNHDGDVYDPFAGSFTTLIAAARQGRRAFCLEIDPRYVDVGRRRWTTWARRSGIEPGPGALE